MKKYFVFFIALMLFSSCQEDIIESQVNEEISDPIVVDNTSLSGRVLDTNGDVIADAAVELYQDGESIGQVFSDSQGEYNTSSITVDPFKSVVVKYQKEEYLEKYRSLTIEPEQSIKKDVILGTESLADGVDAEESALSNALDTNLIKIYGYARFANGDPAVGAECRAIWDFESPIPNFVFITRLARDYTDQDGYFELYVPKDSVLYFRSKTALNDNTFNACEFYFNPDNPVADNILGEVWNHVDLGIITEDTMLELDDTNVINSIMTTVSGVAKYCDGSPVTQANIGGAILALSIIPVEGLSIKDYQFGADGSFQFDIIGECIDNRYMDLNSLDVIVAITDTVIGFTGDATIPFDEIANVGEVLLCTDQNDYDDEFELDFDGNVIDFEQGWDYSNSGVGNLRTEFSDTENDIKTIVKFTIEDVKLGENPVSYIQMRKGQVDGNTTRIIETTFEEEPASGLVANVTSIEPLAGRAGSWVTGELNGQVLTSRGMKNLSATFRIFDK